MYWNFDVEVNLGGQTEREKRWTGGGNITPLSNSSRRDRVRCKVASWSLMFDDDVVGVCGLRRPILNVNRTGGSAFQVFASDRNILLRASGWINKGLLDTNTLCFYWLVRHVNYWYPNSRPNGHSTNAFLTNFATMQWRNLSAVQTTLLGDSLHDCHSGSGLLIDDSLSSRHFCLIKSHFTIGQNMFRNCCTLSLGLSENI